jgi:hypothetical protein
MVFLLVTLACLGKVETAEDFEAAYADSQCHAYRQCNRMIFDGKYDGMADCKEQVENNLREENQTLFDTCTFNAEKANECIESMNMATCGELWTDEQALYSACHEAVWECQ